MTDEARFRLVALDVDGTLLNPQGHVSPRTAAAVRAVLERGVLVVLCTGRVFSDGVGQLGRELGLHLPAIVRNGGAVQDIATGKVLAQRTISPDALRAALNAIVAAGGTPMVQEGARHGDTIYLPPREESHPAAAYFEQRWRYNADRIVRLPSTPALYDVREPWWIGGAGTYAAVAQAFATLRRIAGVRSYLTGGEDYEGEYHLTGAVPETCTKAAALADYAAEHGFTLAEVLAVGDFYNDLEMIREAGFGVAMGQAPDLVKAAADAIAPDHAHDGCAVALERYILGRV